MGGNLVIQVGDEMHTLTSRVPKAVWSRCSLKNRDEGRAQKVLAYFCFNPLLVFMTLER